MVYLMLLFLEVALLFFLSRIVSRTLSRFLSVGVLSLLFLPGVIVHELSHLLAAGILFVRVGEIEFRPKVTDAGIKLGSVAIAKTDPVRRAIIGFAPIGVGLLIIFGLMYFQSPFSSFWGVPITFYLLFVISNTMFSSSADMEGALELLVVFLVIFGAFYLVGFRLPTFFIKSLSSKEFVDLIQKSSMFLLAPIIIDLAILGAIRLISNKR